jgi:ketosteroid isomerase-like protein
MISKKEKDQKEVEELVRKLQNTWMENKVSELDSFFDDNVVFFHPARSEKVVGKAAMIESYQQFLSSSTVHHFKITHLNIDVYDNTAIAVLTFDVVYQIQDNTYQEKGNDLMILNKNNNDWKIIWRTQIPM